MYGDVRGALVGACLLISAISVPAAPQAHALATTDAQALPRLPVEFETNEGQHPRAVRYLARASKYQVILTDGGPVLALPRTAKGAATRTTLIPVKFVGAALSRAQLEAQERSEHKANYFIGSDPSRHYTGIPNFKRVVYRSVYPGIDVAFYGKDGQVEFDFLLAAGADPARIALAYPREVKLEVDQAGDLTIGTQAGVVRQHKPLVYQEVAGARRVVEAAYRVMPGNQVTFALASYDSSKPLVIDPVLSYSTYLGGSAADQLSAIAVDAAGNAYVAGDTSSVDFPVLGAYQSAAVGTSNAFVAKLNPQGTGLIYSTYLGGRRSDSGARAIAIDASGNAYIGATTTSNTYPATSGAYSIGTNNLVSVVVTKLNPSGNALVYSTYFSGNHVAGIGVDSAGNATIAGIVYNNTIPTTPGAFKTTNPSPGGDTGYITKFNPTGTGLVYSTYLGGFRITHLNALAVDPAGNAYVTGDTLANDFPIVAGAYQANWRGNYDLFVSKLNPAGSALVFSTYLGGGSDDYGHSIAVDSSGKTYVGGYTLSSDFPGLTSFGTFTYRGFVSAISADGRALGMSTYMAGATTGDARALAVDPTGTHLYVGGYASGGLTGLKDPIQASLSGDSSAFVAKFIVDPATGKPALHYATVLGGMNWVNGLGVDALGNAYVAGLINPSVASTFPTTAGALQVGQKSASNSDGFIFKVSTLGRPVSLEGQCGGSGQTTQLRADVALNATGNVVFMDGNATIGSAPIVNGVARFSAPSIVGVHKYTATKSSDSSVSVPLYCAVDQ
jgi:hypothetical protein